MVLHSVASRLAMGVVLGSAIVMLTTGGLLLVHTREQVLDQTQREYTALASGAAQRIQNRIDGVGDVAQVLAGMLGTRRDQAQGLIRDALASNPDIVNITAAFVPRDNAALREDDAPVARRAKDGRITLASRVGESELYWSAPWFIRGLNCDRGCWQPPFRSFDREQTLIGYSVAIPGKNIPVIGVADVTVSIEWLQAALGELEKTPHAYAFVLDGNGDFLAHEWTSYISTRGSTALLSALANGKGAPVRLTPEEGGRISEPVWVYFVPVKGTRWTFGLVVPERQIFTGVRRNFLVDAGLGALTLFGVFLIAILLARRLMAPLGVLADRAEHVARGELDFALPTLRGDDEVARLNRAFDDMRRQLAVHIEGAKRSARDQARMASELEIARQIQLALLPEPHYVADNGKLELYATLQPASAVGGDLYAYFMLGADHLCVMVGDVSDKGIPAALFMARTITLARTVATHARSPRDILAVLNRELCKDNDTCMFVTLLCGVIETETGMLSLASAGHEQPVLHAGGTTNLVDVETGPALGLDSAASYPVRVLTLLEGDTVLMYTDGVSEAHNDRQRLYGAQSLLDSVARVEEGSAPEAYVDRVLSDVDTYVEGRAPYDDIALLALTWREARSEGVRIDAAAHS
ncbi:sigma-B regulation protein RsbU (phosphoserine phosphatase) [Luteibacter rhizovicinus]|uniref:Sigma-B regulation protein RsbU (Phosphoserine phosphatase) n=1 Tax=Luteibacter rhizovicinus TaxID=242606 RepID=A0A4R3YIA9_9GAMM|nr:SpoIIE family protein phosphatase [Luteibacter rhizovicinus]TCV91831.1 sigma-B regulation protein RsbU (phosphoserine phosphatase) [Luteibacter rhizovicinus]